MLISARPLTRHVIGGSSPLKERDVLERREEQDWFLQMRLSAIFLHPVLKIENGKSIFTVKKFPVQPFVTTLLSVCPHGHGGAQWVASAFQRYGNLNSVDPAYTCFWHVVLFIHGLLPLASSPPLLSLLFHFLLRILLFQRLFLCNSTFCVTADLSQSSIHRFISDLGCVSHFFLTVRAFLSLYHNKVVHNLHTTRANFQPTCQLLFLAFEPLSNLQCLLDRPSRCSDNNFFSTLAQSFIRRS